MRRAGGEHLTGSGSNSLPEVVSKLYFKVGLLLHIYFCVCTQNFAMLPVRQFKTILSVTLFSENK